MSGVPQRALATVNVAAIERNAARLRAALTGGAELCAVVKADGYGHGAAAAARAALAGGASRLAVATAGEALALREALGAAAAAVPLIVLGALGPEELATALAARAEVVAWEPRFLAAVAGAVRRGAAGPVPIHVKLDTGMGRLGTRVAADALAVAEAAVAEPAVRLAGVMTHFASADSDPEFTAAQLARFRTVADPVRARHPGVAAHAANSAAILGCPAAHLDFARAGIALYGLDPWNEDAAAHGLEPVLGLESWLAAVKAIAPGESTGYGRRHIAARDSVIGTVPIGYADGVRRGLSNRGEVLVAGRRAAIVGTVSMDNITVELGPDGAAVPVGTRAVLIGHDGGAQITAEAVAARLGTINYEVTCGISARVPRRHHRDGEPLP